MKNKDEILITLRKEAQVLMKFKHPSSLRVLEPLMVLNLNITFSIIFLYSINDFIQEDDKFLAFITEPFEYPLSYLISSNLLD